MESESCKEQGAAAQPGTKATKINQEPGILNSFATPTPEKPEWSSKARAITSLAKKQLTEEFQNEGGIGGSASDTTSLVADPYEEADSSHSTLPKEKSVELPEKYKVLSDFFNRIGTSIRLLGLRKLLPTFGNISRQVEILTKRKLLYRHIAQMKYVYPEAFQIEKILVHDQRSLLMIPEMKITLLKDIVDHLPSSRQSAFMVLCETFHVKLTNFFLCHPEGQDIPVAELPEPFNQRDYDSPIKELSEVASVELLSETSSELESFSNASHLPSSFHKKFFQKDIKECKTRLLVTTDVALESLSNRDETEIDGNSQRPEISSSTSIIGSPASVECPSSFSVVSQCFEGTPVKGLSHFPDLTAGTPVQQTPKRPVPTPQQKFSAEDVEIMTEDRLTMSARRSLMYSPTTSKESKHFNTTIEQDASAKRSLWDNKDGYDQLNSDLLHTLCAGKGEHLGDKKHCEMLACLLETFNAIYCIPKSTNSSVITKEELVHKILSVNLEIEETREVEEHLHLLEQLFPDWICKLDTSDGQFLYSIKKTSERDAFRARLMEAVV